MYPTTKRQVTPRKRAVGIRPRTFNFYCQFESSQILTECLTESIIDWLPNHMLVIHIMLLFAVLNPLVIPFGFIYFCIEAAVVKNQARTDYTSTRTTTDEDVKVNSCVRKDL